MNIIIPKNAKLVFAFDAATERAIGSSSGAPWNHLAISPPGANSILTLTQDLDNTAN